MQFPERGPNPQFQSKGKCTIKLTQMPQPIIQEISISPRLPNMPQLNKKFQLHQIAVCQAEKSTARCTALQTLQSEQNVNIKEYDMHSFWNLKHIFFSSCLKNISFIYNPKISLPALLEPPHTVRLWLPNEFENKCMKSQALLKKLPKKESS